MNKVIFMLVGENNISLSDYTVRNIMKLEKLTRPIKWLLKENSDELKSIRNINKTAL